MTLRELVEQKKDAYFDYEVCEFVGIRKNFHTDNIRFLDDYPMDAEVEDFEIMDEQDYDMSVLANSSERADFGMWYDDPDAKIMVVAIIVE